MCSQYLFPKHICTQQCTDIGEVKDNAINQAYLAISDPSDFKWMDIVGYWLDSVATHSGVSVGTEIAIRGVLLGWKLP